MEKLQVDDIFLPAAAVAFFIQSKRQNMSHFVIGEDYQTN